MSNDDRREIVVEHLGGSSLAGTTQRFALDLVRVGRRSENELVFDPQRDRSVSGNHLELARDGEGIELRDLGSHNGTWVGERQVQGRCRLEPGDEVRIGAQGPRMRVRLVRASAPVGEETMARAISAASVTGARRGRRALVAATAVVAILALVGGAVLWRVSQRQAAVDETLGEAQAVVAELRSASAASIAESLGRLENELSAVQGELGKGEAELARLMVELQARDEDLAAIRERQDLSQTERDALTAEAERKLGALAERLASTEADLRSGGEGDWSGHVERYGPGVFLCVASDPATGEGGIGTAFCIREDGVLATNAHVVHLLEAMPQRFVVQNGSGQIFAIEDMLAHPRFGGVASPDVGLIRIALDGAELPVLPLADDQRLQALRIGTQLGTLGYPGELAQLYLSQRDFLSGRITSALATFKDGWVGRITDYHGKAARFTANHLIQHSASLSGGTSGSPMFAADGVVVAINNGGLGQNVVVQDATGATGIAETVSASEIGFAIRIDVVRALLERAGW